MRPYDYDRLMFELHDTPSVYTVGHTAFGRRILMVSVGVGPPWAIVHAAIHAREWITTPLVMAMMRRYAALCAHHPLPTVHFVPMVNPDGVQLCIHGTASAPVAHRAALDLWGDGHMGQWKANGLGVDLNVNFDADWGQGVHNVRHPGAANYIGPYPASEAEVQTLMRLTSTYRYAVSLAYHAKGQEVYYGYGCGAHRHQGMQTAQWVAGYLGYTAHTSLGSAGGYKDWHCLLDPTAHAITIEVGDDALCHPIGMEHLPALVARHIDLLPTLAQYMGRV